MGFLLSFEFKKMSNIGANQTFLSRRTVKSHRHGGTAQRDKFINE